MALLFTGVLIIYITVCILFAYINNRIRIDRISKKDTRQINHFVWGLYYGIACAPLYFLFRNWWLIGSVILLRLSVFPIMYNVFAKIPIFNLSKSTTAITDQVIRKLGFTNTKIINITTFILSALFLVLAINTSSK